MSRLKGNVLRQIIREEIMRAYRITSDPGSGLPSSSTLASKRNLNHSPGELAMNKRWNPEFSEYNDMSGFEDDPAGMQAMHGDAADEDLYEEDLGSNDAYEPVDENHRPSNRNQMMFPLHALRESKLRLRRPS